MTRKLNAYFTHAEAQYFLARRGGRVIGADHGAEPIAPSTSSMKPLGDVRLPRVRGRSAIVDALLAAAADWLRERGRDRMVGPMDFVLNDEGGVLVEGFEREPLIREPWNPPYYSARARPPG